MLRSLGRTGKTREERREPFSVIRHSETAPDREHEMRGISLPPKEHEELTRKEEEQKREGIEQLLSEKVVDVGLEIKGREVFGEFLRGPREGMKYPSKKGGGP